MTGLFYIIGIIVIAILLANGGLLLVRRSVSLSKLEKHNDVAGFIYAVVGVLYGVLLAFVVVVVWEMNRDSETTVENEAKNISDIFLNADAFPIDMRKLVREEIINYVRIVLEKEWKMMSDDRLSEEAERSFHRLVKLFRDYKPKNSHENIWYSLSIEYLDEFGDSRRLRLLGGRQKIPPFMWLILIAGGIMTVSFSFLFGSKNLWAQIVMVSVLTAIVTMTLTLIWALESPFSGIIQVEPDAFRLQLEGFLRVMK